MRELIILFFIIFIFYKFIMPYAKTNILYNDNKPQKIKRGKLLRMLENITQIIDDLYFCGIKSDNIKIEQSYGCCFDIQFDNKRIFLTENIFGKFNKEYESVFSSLDYMINKNNKIESLFQITFYTDDFEFRLSKVNENEMMSMLENLENMLIPYKSEIQNLKEISKINISNREKQNKSIKRKLQKMGVL